MPFLGQSPASAALTASDITDGIISNAKLAQDVISADTALAVAPADTDEFLVSDGGVLKRIDYSLIKGGGDSVRLATQTISSSVSDFTIDNVFSSTYQIYKLFWSDVDYSAAAYPLIQFVISGDGTVSAGSTYKVKLQFMYNGLTSSAASDGAVSSTTGFRVTGAYDHNHSDYGSTGEVTFFNPASNTFNNPIQFGSSIYDGSHWRWVHGIGVYDGAKISATGIKVTSSTGTIDTGEFVLVGYKRA